MIAIDYNLSPSASMRSSAKAGAVFEAHDHTCSGCGFRSEKYQIVRTWTDASGAPQSAVYCIFCDQCRDLTAIESQRSGVMIHLPELTQRELHFVAREIYVARIGQGPHAELAKLLLTALMERRTRFEAEYGGGEALASFINMLRTARASGSQRNFAAEFADLRLMPLDRRIVKEADLEFNHFPQILAYWRSKDGPLTDRSFPWFDLARVRLGVCLRVA